MQMDGKTTYEHILAEKLEHPPLPDLEEVVWSRIKTMIACQMVPDHVESARYGKGISKVVLISCIAGFISTIAVVIVWLQLHKNYHIYPAVHPVFIHPPAHTIKPDTGSDIPVTPPEEYKHGKHLNRSVLLNKESFKVDPLRALEPEDTMRRIQFQVPVNKQLPIRRDSLSAPRKPVGVKGITDDDYRFTPKSDSIK